MHLRWRVPKVWRRVFSVEVKIWSPGLGDRHMFYDGVFDNLDGMVYLPEGWYPRPLRCCHTYWCGCIVPLDMFMDYVPDTAAFKVLSDTKNAPSYICKVRPLSSSILNILTVPSVGETCSQQVILQIAIRISCEDCSTRGMVADSCILSQPCWTWIQLHKNIKMTICAPEWFHLRHGSYAYEKSVYSNDGTAAHRKWHP